MTTPAPFAQKTLVKKHDRSDALQHARRLQPTGERPTWLGARSIIAPSKAELGWLDGISTPAVFDGLDQQWWQQVLPALRTAFATWRQRARMRSQLSQVDARSLTDAGISPGAAAFEVSQPFWQSPISLRDYPGDKTAA
ncbi:MAG: DUF1127 domain-containing protein [Alphaproteobacteria bacterium]|nr:DUF1127 domain-containing protein [Alphaproteobacteria bacterium]